MRVGEHNFLYIMIFTSGHNLYENGFLFNWIQYGFRNVVLQRFPVFVLYSQCLEFQLNTSVLTLEFLHSFLIRLKSNFLLILILQKYIKTSLMTYWRWLKKYYLVTFMSLTVLFNCSYRIDRCMLCRLVYEALAVYTDS